MWRDLQFGLRQLTRNKLLSGVIIVLLAIGIGANTLIFSFINSLLLKTLPVCNPQSLFLLEKDRERQVRPDTGFFYRQYEAVLARKDLIRCSCNSGPDSNAVGCNIGVENTRCD